MAKYNSSYLCVMVDNDRSNLTEVLSSRSKKELGRYFEAIPLSERKQVKYVTIDMWDPYRDIALKYLPNALVCVDSFHVVENLDRAFIGLRIAVMNQMKFDSPKYCLLKKWNKLLIGNFDLDNKPQYNSYLKLMMNDRQLYDLLLKINPTMTLAYRLKEMYHSYNKEARLPRLRRKVRRSPQHFHSR